MDIFKDVQTLKFRSFHTSPEPYSRQVVVCLTMSALPSFEVGLNMISRIEVSAARILAAQLLQAADAAEAEQKPIPGPELRVVSSGVEDPEADALSIN